MSGYIMHKWIGSDYYGECVACGISEVEWERAIEDSPMVEWSCDVIQSANGDSA